MRQQLIQQEQFVLFINSLRSKATRKSYTDGLVDFLKYAKIEDCEKLLKFKPKEIEMLLIQYVVDMRDNRKLAPGSIKNNLVGIQSFFEINDMENINWRKVKRFKGEQYSVVEDRPYTRQEIKRLVDAAHGLRDKAIIFLLSSSGIREGAIVSLQLKHLKKVDKYGIFLIDVYKKAKEHYITFTTPETRKAIEEYLDWRLRLGEKLTLDSPLFRLEFNTRLLGKAKAPARPITVPSLVKNMRRLRDQSGVVPLAEGRGEGRYRSEIMTCHGFRKYFATCLETEAGVNPVYVELLLGHDMGLKSVYSKPTPTQLLEGNGDRILGYIAGINQLTINEENRLRLEMDKLAVDKAKWFELEREMQTLKELLKK